MWPETETGWRQLINKLLFYCVIQLIDFEAFACPRLKTTTLTNSSYSLNTLMLATFLFVCCQIINGGRCHARARKNLSHVVPLSGPSGHLFILGSRPSTSYTQHETKIQTQ